MRRLVVLSEAKDLHLVVLSEAKDLHFRHAATAGKIRTSPTRTTSDAIQPLRCVPRKDRVSSNVWGSRTDYLILSPSTNGSPGG